MLVLLLACVELPVVPCSAIEIDRVATDEVTRAGVTADALISVIDGSSHTVAFEPRARELDSDDLFEADVQVHVTPVGRARDIEVNPQGTDPSCPAYFTEVDVDVRVDTDVGFAEGRGTLYGVSADTDGVWLQLHPQPMQDVPPWLQKRADAVEACNSPDSHLNFALHGAVWAPELSWTRPQGSLDVTNIDRNCLSSLFVFTALP